MQEAITALRRSRRTRQQIEDLLIEFDKADCTVKEFCRVNHVSQAAFHKWRSWFKTNSLRKDIPTGFAEVQVHATSSSALFAEVRGIRLYQPVSAAYLKELFS